MRHYDSLMLMAVILSLAMTISPVTAQDPDEPAVTFAKSIEVTIRNPKPVSRDNIPVVIPIAELTDKAADFNPSFYRVKESAGGFEPLDIPSQIRKSPGSPKSARELVFQQTLAPRERKTIEIWYNPTGDGLPEYPKKTQSFDDWYSTGDHLAWENEIVAYRSYNGILDFFGKTYPHLLLHRLPPDSYHHERIWGLDPYMVGPKPGLGGVMLLDGDRRIMCYGKPDETGNEYIIEADNGGSVLTEARLTVMNDGQTLVSESFTLLADRYDNIVYTRLGDAYRDSDILIAPGLEKFENMVVIKDELAGYWGHFGRPVDEYGVIGTAIIWRKIDAHGIVETEDGVYVKLKPGNDGAVSYRTVALWSRGSDPGEMSSDAFARYIQELASENAMPVMVERIDSR